MKRLLLFFMAWLTFVAPGYAKDIGENESNRALRDLDDALEFKFNFVRRRNYNIDSLRRVRGKYPKNRLEWLLATEKLGDRFAAFNNDSTARLYNEGLRQSLRVGNDSMSKVFAIKSATYLPLAGFLNEAVDLFSEVDTAGMSPKLKSLYLDGGRQMYYYIASFYRHSPEIREYYSGKALELQKQLLEVQNTLTPLYQLNHGEYLLAMHQYSEAQKVLETLLEELPKESNLYARAAHSLATIAAVNGESQRRIALLAKSAESDVISATQEVVSLQELGNYLFNHGEVTRAYTYLQNALENAVACNATTRMLEVSSSLPIIQQAYNDQLRRQERELTVALIILGVLLLGLGFGLFFVYRERNHISRLKINLEQANRTKDVYLGQFMNLASGFIDKLISFNKIVKRKVTSGQIDDLLHLTESGKFVEQQMADFHEAFDAAFLHIYPDFVNQVNKLLLPDKQIVLEKGEKMNINLRILAFMRLGMEDTTQIAQTMNYSVNTIYSYRNRLRNRARNRDTFEEDVKNITGI